jgi:hypothetical protein
MKTKTALRAFSVLAIALAFSAHAVAAQTLAAHGAAQKKSVGSGKIQYVLLLSIDGMHAVAPD